MRRTLFARMLYFGRIVAYVGALMGIVLFALYFAPASVRYRVTAMVRFDGAADDGSVNLAVLLPKSGPYQVVSTADVTWDGNKRFEREPDVDVVKLTANLAAGETKTAQLTYAVTLRQGSVVWDAPMLDFQRAPQARIESDHPQIASDHPQIASDHPQIASQAERLSEDRWFRKQKRV